MYITCDEYREGIAADPHGSFDGAAEHSAQCADCEAFRRGMLALDARIARALKVDVPELRIPELPVTSHEFNVVRMSTRRLSTPVWLGIAASIAVAAVLGIRMLTNNVVYPSLAAEIVAHLDHEPGALRVTTEAVSTRRLDSVVGKYADMDSTAGLISYARSCVINGHTVPHLVIQGEAGPVTVLLLPDEALDTAIPIEGVGIRGVILPVGKGSIAFVGERAEPLEKIEEQVVNSMQWRT
jgi:hypothetical protein